MLETLLEQLGNPSWQYLSEGGECYAFLEDENTVVKVYKDPSQSKWTELHYLQNFLNILGRTRFAYEIPEIYSIERCSDFILTRENRIGVQDMGTFLESANPQESKRVITEYLDLCSQVPTLTPAKQQGYAQVLAPANQHFYSQVPTSSKQHSNSQLLSSSPVSHESWSEFLAHRSLLAFECLKTRLEIHRGVLKVFWGKFKVACETLPEPEPVLVHGDLFPENVQVNERGEVCGLIDFSSHTIVGDHLYDLVGAIEFLPMSKGFKPEHLNYLRELSQTRFGIERSHTSYLVYLGAIALYFLQFEEVGGSGSLDEWCLDHLKFVESQLP